MHILLYDILNSAWNYIWSRKYIRILESTSRCSITMMSNGPEVIFHKSSPAPCSATSGSGMWCRHTLDCVLCCVPEGVGDQHSLDWALRTQPVEHWGGLVSPSPYLLFSSPLVCSQERCEQHCYLHTLALNGFEKFSCCHLFLYTIRKFLYLSQFSALTMLFVVSKSKPSGSGVYYD